MTSTPVAFSKEPPANFALPAEVGDEARASDREAAILRHGFTEPQIGPQWWNGLGITIRFDGEDDRLTRAQLFDLGAAVTTTSKARDDEVLDFVWHVLAWGSGTARRNNRRRIPGCRDHVGDIRAALGLAREGKVREAYNTLIRPGKGLVPWLGPAYFTKLLYFASESAEPRCLILDARVARSMYGLGWNMSTLAPKAGFSYNWYTVTYVTYCDLLASWADQANAGDSSQVAVTPDMLERVLFKNGGA